VVAFTLHMHHEARHRRRRGHAAATDLRIELAEPAVDAEHLQLLLRERLARVPAGRAHAGAAAACATRCGSSPAPNAELFPTRQSERAGLVRLLERLRARLGDEQVQQLQPQPDHRPEHGSRTSPVPALSALAPCRAHFGAGAGSPRPCHTRPVWLLPDPQPLAERQATAQLDGRPLQLLAGPERIETGWWDGALATRDYFIAQAADGSLVWVYRARLPVSDANEALWFLQGRFG
jgi:protein ImuB